MLTLIRVAGMREVVVMIRGGVAGAPADMFTFTWWEPDAASPPPGRL
jgi:hypothetical protein